MKKALERLLQHALQEANKGGALRFDSPPPLLLEVPKDPQHGDLACTVALGLARAERRPPRQIAETILAHLQDPDGILAGTEIAGPGYLNFRFSARYWQRCLTEASRPEAAYADLGSGKRVLIEFVSTNPTGPLHVGHGRGAVLGDAVARLLEATGHDVVREYYVNDAGRQIDTLGRSALARLRQAYGDPVELPEDGYPGEYLRDLVSERRDDLMREIVRRVGRPEPADDTTALEVLREAGEEAVAVCGMMSADWLLGRIKDDMAALAVRVDSFVSERELTTRGVVARAMEALEERELLYHREGARWFRSTDFGDEKDRVVERSNGELTYFAGDIAYHQQKLAQGFDQLINVWGADHHGYVKRVEAAIEALGGDPRKLRVLLVQIVRLTRGGEPVRMGKRTGEFVTMQEIVEEVGADAARFFFLMRKADSHLEFDLDLAKKQSAENPVFYVQYAHARICSLFRQADEAGLKPAHDGDDPVEHLSSVEEQDLIRLLARLSDVVEEAARELEPHRVVFHLIEVAAAFHRFYNRHRIVGVEEEVSRARLYLAATTRRIIQTGLGLLGVRAPESM